MPRGRDGSRMLVRGRDYTVSADHQKVTFSAAALTALVGNRDYGVNAVLSARFSRGVPWQFHVITYDTPSCPARRERPTPW